MATGIIGAITSGSLTYTAPSDAKVMLSGFASTNGTITVNGARIAAQVTSGNTMSATFFIGAGQTATISVTNGELVASVLEGS